MRPTTVNDLRRLLDTLDGDTVLTDAATGRLVDIDLDPDGSLAVAVGGRPMPRRSVTNTVTGGVVGTLIQTGGDLHGTLSL